jgi:hypothetical protein
MSLGDLVEDGTWYWLFRGANSGVACDDDTLRTRVDVWSEDHSFHRSVPAISTVRRLREAVPVMRAKLKDDCSVAGFDRLHGAVDEVCDALEAALQEGE